MLEVASVQCGCLESEAEWLWLKFYIYFCPLFKHL